MLYKLATWEVSIEEFLEVQRITNSVLLLIIITIPKIQNQEIFCFLPDQHSEPQSVPTKTLRETILQEIVSSR